MRSGGVRREGGSVKLVIEGTKKEIIEILKELSEDEETPFNYPNYIYRPVSGTETHYWFDGDRVYGE